MRPLMGAVVGVCLLVSGCASSDPGGSRGSSTDGTGAQIAAEVASYDLAAGPGKQRFIVGLFTRSNHFIDYGKVGLDFSYIGTKNGPSGAKGPSISAEGDFIGVADTTLDHPPSQPEALPPSQGRGVYGAAVRFDKPGYWRVHVSVDVKGMGTEGADAAFQVLSHHQVPMAGQEAPRTDTLTMASHAPKPAIDSRAQGNKPVPDPQLHRTSIAESIKRREPALVVFATPVYCISEFCGPTTDMVDRLSKRFSDKANFIHVEIWRNYQHHVINKGAADWLYHGGDLHEPWVFLIGANGRIVARWDNVVNASEVVPYLKALPKMGP